MSDIIVSSVLDLQSLGTWVLKRSVGGHNLELNFTLLCPLPSATVCGIPSLWISIYP